MLFERIFRELETGRVRYLVIGGIAVNLHGFARATGDLDIMISYDKNNVEAFIKTIKTLKFRANVPVGIEEFGDAAKRNVWLRSKNMKVFSLHNPENPMEQIDIILENYIDFDGAYDRKELMTAGSVTIPIMSIDDLIELKKIAGRERDALDIRTLEKIKELKHESK